MDRLRFVDVVKGICIMLVVVGHYAPTSAPEWYDSFKLFIYSFHMPVFMAMAGVLFYKGFKPEGSLKDFMIKKFKRLLIPYFFISIIIIITKLFFYKVGIGDSITGSLFLEMLYYPSSAFFLWFMYTLFIIFFICVVFLKYLKNGLYIITVLSIPLYFFTVYLGDYPILYYLYQAFSMLPYFLIGCWIYKESIFVSKQKSLIIALMALHTILYVFTLKSSLDNQFVSRLLYLIMGMLACVYLSKFCFIIENKTKKCSSFFTYIGLASSAIYLFHTSSMYIPKYLWIKYIGIESNWSFLLSVICIMSIGVFIPIVLKKLTNRSHILSMLLLGETEKR